MKKFPPNQLQGCHGKVLYSTPIFFDWMSLKEHIETQTMIVKWHFKINWPLTPARIFDRSWPYNSGRVQDIVYGDVTIVLDILDLLSVIWGFFEGLDNQCCCTGNHINLSSTILNGQSDSDLNFQSLGRIHWGNCKIKTFFNDS